MYHLKKHLIQGLFLLAMAMTANAADLAISGWALLGIVVLILAAVELGLWIIHRRETPNAVDRAAAG